MVAAAVHPDAEIHLTGVGLNPTRTGIIDALCQMGADLSIEEERTVGGEPVGDVVVSVPGSCSAMRQIDGDLTLRMIDEAPAFAVAASAQLGTTEIRDAAELRVKESDRIGDVASELSALGAQVTEREDGMIIEGGAGIRGGEAASHGDHRLAMALAIAGLASRDGVTIEDAGAVTVSYPAFWDDVDRVAERVAQ